MPWLVLMALAALVAQFGGGDSGTASAVHARVTPVQEPDSARAAARLRLDRAVGRVLRHSAFAARGGGRKREIALTFDDGPSTYTPKVLVALNRLDVKATFFVVGRQEPTFRPALMAAIGRGHVLGDHTEGHRRLASLPAAEQYGELLGPLQWLSQHGLPRPQLFRPPTARMTRRRSSS